MTEHGSTVMRWKRSRCIPSASAAIDLITSPWLQASQVASGPSRAFQSRTAATARDWVSAQPLALRAREDGGARVGLHDLPERLLGQFLERAAGPVAVAALADPLVGDDLLVATGGDDLRGVLAALQRAGHDRGERQRAQPLGDPLGLAAAPVVEMHPGRPAGQHRPGHRGQPVTDQDQSRHTAPVASKMITTMPATMRYGTNALIL